MSSIERLTAKLKVSEPLTIGDSQVTFDSGELDDFLTTKAERELRETSDVVQESFKVLCDLIGEDEDLYVPMEMEFLQAFLRRCKWYPKSAYKLIKRYYEYKKNHPEFFSDLLPSNERACLLTGCVVPLPRRTIEGCRVVVVEVGSHIWKPKEVTLNQLFRAVLICLEVVMAEPVSQVSGVRVLVDVGGLSLSQVTYFSPKFAGKIVDFVQRCLPCRLKGVHIVNQSFVFDMVFAFFKPFLKGKIKDRIYFHGTDKSSILTHFDAKCLPKKYGGEFKSETPNIGEKLYKFAINFDEYFTEISRYGYTKNS